MDIKSIVKCFFFDEMANNGGLEAIGNRLMSWLNLSPSRLSIEVNQDRYSEICRIANKMILRVAATINGLAHICLAYNIYAWIFLGREIKQLYKVTFIPIVIPPVMVLTGVILKILSWFKKSVRERNFQYLLLKQKEQLKEPSYLLPASKLKIQTDQKKITFSSKDKFTPLPIVLKQKIMEYLGSDSNKLQITSKIQFKDVFNSVKHVNHLLIKQIFPASILQRLGMEKIVRILSQPCLKQKLDAFDLIQDRNHQLQYHGAPSYQNAKVWEFQTSDMEKKAVRWGKTKAGDIYLAFSYKVVEYFKGLSILILKGRQSTLTHAIDKRRTVWYEPIGSFYHIKRAYDKIQSFFVNEYVLAIEDYIPRLLNGEPCGKCEKQTNGDVIEGPRLHHGKSLIELSPLD